MHTGIVEFLAMGHSNSTVTWSDAAQRADLSVGAHVIT
jgi:hypothetical protein